MRSRREILDTLQAYECRNVTFVAPDGSWPIVWESARGCHVTDESGRRYLDLTAAFGVAAAGHANPRVVAAGQRQMARLLHAMGDVHPHALKAELARELNRLTFERWTAPRPSRRRLTGKVLFGNSGFEAVEAALKTALLATQRPGVLAFTGSYHGLGYGAVAATHRLHFRGPVRPQLRSFVRFVPFPTNASAATRGIEFIQDQLATGRFGAVLIEPIQGRGGVRVPPPGFLPALRRECSAANALLIVDEVFTGFGRTGEWFACEQESVIPDLICLGKALTGGFPLSACVGTAAVMDAAWPVATGEAIHTSTFLGHPVGCAMALAQLREIDRRQLPARAARLGAWLRRELEAVPVPSPWRGAVRGRGLMLGLALARAKGTPAADLALRTVQAMLRRGFICLPEGNAGEVISFSPPLTISETQLRSSVTALRQSLREAAES